MWRWQIIAAGGPVKNCYSRQRPATLRLLDLALKLSGVSVVLWKEGSSCSYWWHRQKGEWLAQVTQASKPGALRRRT